MKPTRDIHRVQSLIRQHETIRDACRSAADHHQQRVEVLTDYVRELRKPGFRYSNARILAATKQKEDYIITASNTHKEDV